jgi:DNA-directed RNA polymerase specialized sigma24 family protein
MRFFNFTYCFYPEKLLIIKNMTGYTIEEMSALLKLPEKTIATRINRAKIKPMTRQALYDKKTVKAIKEVSMGRPKKPQKDKTQPEK